VNRQGIRWWLQNRTPGRDLHGGDAPREQDEQPVAMPAPKHAAVARKSRDRVVDDVLVIDRGRVLITDIQVVTAHEPNA
jgi:hypothetical protein